MGLADDIIKQNASDDPSLKYDDVGLPIPETKNNDYIVSRIICRNKRRLFKVGDNIWYDRKVMSGRIKDNLIILNGKTDNLIRGDNCILIWERLKEVLPEYNRDYIKIADGLVWNRRKADIENEKFN